MKTTIVGALCHNEVCVESTLAVEAGDGKAYDGTLSDPQSKDPSGGFENVYIQNEMSMNPWAPNFYRFGGANQSAGKRSGSCKVSFSVRLV